MASAAEILSIEVILCLILKNLPPADILVCRRVCTYFNNAINTSHDVKYACYLPIPPRAGSVPDHTPAMNPLTDAEENLEGARRKPIFEAISYLREHEDLLSDDPSTSSATYTFNPLLEAICPRFFSTPDTTSMWKRWDSLEEHRAAFMRKGESWASMTLTQPPVTSLAIVHIKNGWRGGKSYRFGTIITPTGLTMGVLYAYVCKHLAQPYASFVIDWNHIDEEREFTDDTWHVLFPLGKEQGKRVDISDFQVVLFCAGVDDDDHFHDNGGYDRESSYGQKWLAQWTPEGEDMLKDVRITSIDGREVSATQFMNRRN